MQSEIERTSSPSACRAIESSLSENDFKTALFLLVVDAFNQYVKRNIEDASKKSEILARIPGIVCEHESLERIHALLIYMNDVQFQLYREEIVALLSMNSALFEALIDDSQELEEAYEILSIEIRKFLNLKGIQAVMSFQFQGKIQRRLDSLARILIPAVRYTVCVALTIVGDKLFISANHDSAWTQLCANHIWNRLDLFRKFIENLPSEYCQAETFEQHQAALGEQIEGFLPSLCAQGGYGGNRMLIIQAIQKVVFACASPLSDEEHDNVERDNFTHIERFAILENPVVKLLIPKKIDGEEILSAKNLCYSEFTTSVEEGSEDVSVTERIHLIGKFHSNLSIRYIHCEQLLLYYFDTMKGVLSPRSYADIKLLRLGISKLCCQTCIVAIDEWNHRQQKGKMQVAVRGWHEKTYLQVLNLFNPQAYSIPSPRKAKKTPEEAESSDLLELLARTSTFNFHKPLEIEGVVIPNSTPKRAADLMELTAESDGLSTPKKNKRKEEDVGGHAGAFIPCANALVSPNSPYESGARIQNSRLLHHLYVLPLSFTRIGEMSSEGEVPEKNSKSC